MTRDPRKEAIKAQRIAADSAARVRSYLGALAVYRPGCVPAELRAEAAQLQERAAVAYADSIDAQAYCDSVDLYLDIAKAAT